MGVSPAPSSVCGITVLYCDDGIDKLWPRPVAQTCNSSTQEAMGKGSGV